MSQSYPAPTTGLGVAAKIVSAGNVNTVAGKASVPGYNDVVLSLSGANGPTTFQLNPQIQDASGAEIDPGTALTLTAVAASSGPGIITLTSVAASSGGSAVYEGTTSGGGSNAWEGYSFVVAGFENGPNNGTFVCTASTTSSITLHNNNAVAETHAATASSDEGVAVYSTTGTGVVGATYVVAGFVTNPTNNGTFIATAVTAGTSVTLANPDAVAETHAATATEQELQAVISAAANASNGQTVYTGTFPFYASITAGTQVVITGFVTNTVNNGTFEVASVTSTTLTVYNAAGVSESHAAAAVFGGKLTYVVYGFKTLTGNTYQPSGTSTAVATVSSTGLVTAVALGGSVVETSFPTFNNDLGNIVSSGNIMNGLPIQKIYVEQRITVKI
jgi:hypothetical protein